MSLSWNIDIQLLKDILLIISTSISLILGLSKVTDIFQKKPSLEISRIYDQIAIWKYAGYVKIQLEVWNGRRWWQRFRISEATHLKCHITTVENGKVFEDGSGFILEELEIVNLPPKSYTSYHSPIFYIESKNTFLYIKISCDEGVETKKIHKIEWKKAIPEDQLRPDIMEYTVKHRKNF